MISDPDPRPEHGQRETDGHRVQGFRAEPPGDEIDPAGEQEREPTAFGQPGHATPGPGSFDGFPHELLRGGPVRSCLGPEDQPVREDGRGDGLDVVRKHVVAPVGKRTRFRDAQQGDPGPRARTQVQPLVASRRADEVDDVPAQARLDKDARRLLDHVGDPGRVRHRLEVLERRVARLLGQHPRLLVRLRVADVEPHREAVELRLRQRVRALVLDRVLGRHDHEGPAQRVADAVDRDLILLHALEERRLRLRWGAVDLVDEEKVREDRARPELELVRALVEDVDARDVGRQQVGRELQAREGAVDRARHRLGQHRLPHAREVLDDQVPLADQGEDAEPERLRRCMDDLGEVGGEASDDVGRLLGRGGRLLHQIEPLDLVQDGCGDRLFRRLFHDALPLRRDDHDLVVLGIETHVLSGYVVVDDEIDLLVSELRACAVEALGRCLGREADEHLAVGAALTEPLEDVCGRLELDRPCVLVLRALGVVGLRRAVVGDRGGHQDDVCVRGARDALHVGRGRRIDDLHAVRGWNSQVRGDERHVRPAALRLLGERHAHPSGRAVADEAHRVERLACAAGGDEDALPGQRAVASAEQLLRSFEDLLGLGHPPHSELALGRLALVGADQLHAAVAKRRRVRLRGGMRPHARVHGRRDEHRAAVCQRRLGEHVVREPVGELRHGVRGQRRDHEQIGARQVRIEVFPGGPPGERREGLAPHEPVRSARDERDHVVSRADEEPRQFAGLVGGDATCDSEQHPGHGDIVPTERKVN